MKSTTHPIEPEEVMAYLDGELAGERAAAVGAHLEQCAECAAVAAELRGVSVRMAEWQVEAAPQQLVSEIEKEVSNVVSAVSQAPQRKAMFEWAQKSPQRIWQLAFGGAVVLLIGAIMVPNLLRAPSAPMVADDRIAGLMIGPAEQSADQSRVPDRLRSGEGELKRRSTDDRNAFSLPLAAQQGNIAAGSGLVRLAGKVGPMVVRTASVTLETKQFDATRAAVERIVRALGGHLGQLQTAAPLNEARTLTATLRIPAERMDTALAEIKKLGRVMRESQGSDEVTEQYTDLVARLANSRNTEQRLMEILRTRTGKVEEVLEVEREIASVREEIERMEAQRKSLENRVALSTVSLELREEFEKKISVAPPSTGTLLWNAMADGLDGAFESVLALALFVLRAGPSLLLWAALLFVPARLVWRRMRAATAA